MELNPKMKQIDNYFESTMMSIKNRNALLFLLPAICFLAVGAANYKGRTFVFYGDIMAGILFILVAIKNYKRKNI